MFISQALKAFISMHEDALSQNKPNFGYLYSEAVQYLSYNDISTFTELIYSIGLDPLKDLKYIPIGFLYGTFRKNFIIPDHIVEIDAHAFAYSNLENIILPKSVTKIGLNAFRACENLKNIYYTGSPHQKQNIAIINFNAIGNECNLLNANWHYNYKGN